MVTNMAKVLVLVFLALCGSIAQGVEITVQVDRNPVAEDESFTMEYSAESGVDGDPDFSPLEKDFKILQRGQSNNIQFINGRMTRKMSWTLSLMAKRSGKLTVPSISFGRDKARPMTIRVDAASTVKSGMDASVIYMEVSAEPKTAYVQSQIIYTVRIYHAVNLMDASLTELTVNNSNTIIEKLSSDSSFDKRLNGRNYKVFEQRYALFPQDSGELTIEPLIFETRFVDRTRSLRNKRIRSDSIKITIIPIPTSKLPKGSTWLPATSMQLTEEWVDGNPKFEVGEPITRSIKLVANGLPASILPEMGNAPLKFAKMYPDQANLEDKNTLTGVVGTRTEKMALIPTVAGDFILPAIEVPWWNSVTNRVELAKIDARKIKIAAGSVGKATSIAPSPSQQLSTTDLAQTDAAQGQTRAVKGSDNSIDEFPAYFSKKIWFSISILFLYLWLLTIAAWWYFSRKRNKQNDNGIDAIKSANRRLAEKGLKVSCIAGDLEGSKSQLLVWAKAVWPSETPESLGAIAKRCGGDLAAEINQLNALVYGGKVKQWNGDNLFQAVKNFKLESEKGADDDELEKMYYHVN